jgi:predicted transcriptional regulator
MGMRTVRLDEEAERELARLRNATGLSISEVLKRGLKAYRAQVAGEAPRLPYEVYKQLDLGAGGYARSPARQAKAAVADLIRRKHRR